MNPWEDPNSPWKSKAAYFSWLRGNLRKAWMRYPISKVVKNKQCRKALPEDGFSKQTKFVATCSRCQNLFAKSHLQVDHINAAGSLTCWEDVAGFTRRLLGPVYEELRLVCTDCHEIITLAERYKCGEAEAILRKKAAAFGKMPAEEQILTMKSIVADVPTNAKKRRVAYEMFLGITQKDAVE